MLEGVAFVGGEAVAFCVMSCGYFFGGDGGFEVLKADAVKGLVEQVNATDAHGADGVAVVGILKADEFIFVGLSLVLPILNGKKLVAGSLPDSPESVNVWMN